MHPFENWTPRARQADLVVSAVHDEVLIHDRGSQAIHHLGAVATTVWQRCDGRHSPAQLAAATAIDRDRIDRALAELLAAGLLDPEPSLAVKPTRRRFVRGAVAAPLVITVLAPTAASAQSAGTWSGSWVWENDQWVWIWFAIPGPNGEPPDGPHPDEPPYPPPS